MPARGRTVMEEEATERDTATVAEGRLSEGRLSGDPGRFAWAWRWGLPLLLQLVLAGVVYQQAARFRVRVLGDSPAYMHAAQRYYATGEVRIDYWHEPGYKLYNVMLAALLPESWALAPAPGAPENPHGEQLTNLGVVSVESLTVLHALAVLLLGLAAWRACGRFAGLAAYAPFLIDKFNNKFLRSVMSEGPARIFLILWLAALLWAWSDRKRTAPLIALALCAAGTMLCRGPFLPVVGLSGLLIAYDLLGPRRRASGGGLAGAVGRGALCALCLLGPILGWMVYTYQDSGFLGVSAAGGTVLSGRTVPLARPERIADFGSRPALFEAMIRDLSNDHRARQAEGRPATDAVGRRNVYQDRFAVINYIQNWHAERGETIDEAEALMLSQEVAWIAFHSNRPAHLRESARVFADFLTLPLRGGTEDEDPRIVWLTAGAVLLALTMLLLRSGQGLRRWRTRRAERVCDMRVCDMRVCDGRVGDMGDEGENVPEATTSSSVASHAEPNPRAISEAAESKQGARPSTPDTPVTPVPQAMPALDPEGASWREGVYLAVALAPLPLYMTLVSFTHIYTARYATQMHFLPAAAGLIYGVGCLAARRGRADPETPMD